MSLNTNIRTDKSKIMNVVVLKQFIEIQLV